ncbi:hypothetical protein CTAM01_02088 [Colletotrichum tamarilloi]|uniref:Uncharacterized protein n=1 Tax=Colletotrichum tamarilloi TaxID=1209934 RepID=A0ABQ9RQJ0_9PEZI|nr:uncharacterized protein CTAM01_02088 [Colletotrichum tamarilloi]KAK1509965.1 hypothetical protein CTAM01_02088 [Colletotrichum tamarilloi]
MRLRDTLPPGRYQIYEGILHDLDTLLRSTILNHPAGGKKSLLSMCLNRVPQCAQEIEDWEKSQAVNNGPVSCIKQMAYSLRVYDELQTLGATDNGWSHLRTLLRAHAIHLLKGVIGEGLLDVSFIRILIDYCKAMQFLHETASLTEAMICFLYCKPLESRDTPRVNREGQLPAYLLNLAEDPVVESHLLETFSSLLCKFEKSDPESGSTYSPPSIETGEKSAAHEATRLRLKAAIDGFGRGLSLGRAPSTGNNDSQLLDTTVDFTCSIAHCCGRATGQPSNSYFAKVCELIDTLETPGFARLRGNGAFVLAHKTDDLRDLVFAETLKKDLAEKDGMVVAKGNFTGFRWEEGISEWIAVSPLARRQGDFTREALPRRRSGGRNSDVRVLADRSELNSTTEGADKTGALVFASPRPTGESNGDQVGRRLAGKRKRTQNEDHGSRKRNSGAEIAGIDGVDGIDELGMGPENWPRVLGKSRLGSHVVGARMRDGCRRVIRSSETCSRKVLADLGEQAALNDCGLNDEDELGF